MGENVPVFSMNIRRLATARPPARQLGGRSVRVTQAAGSRNPVIDRSRPSCAITGEVDADGDGRAAVRGERPAEADAIVMRVGA